MMVEPPKPKEGDEICLMCKRPKSKHTPEEMNACSYKLEEFRAQKEGGQEFNETSKGPRICQNF